MDQSTHQSTTMQSVGQGVPSWRGILTGLFLSLPLNNAALLRQVASPEVEEGLLMMNGPLPDPSPKQSVDQQEPDSLSGDPSSSSSSDHESGNLVTIPPPVDQDGYILDGQTLPCLLNASLLQTIALIRQHEKSSRWRCLWKGFPAKAVHDYLHVRVLQPSLLLSIMDWQGLGEIEEWMALSGQFPGQWLDEASTGHPYLFFFSHWISLFLLTPLDVLYTRMVVQSNHPRSGKKYRNFISGAYTLFLQEEGLTYFYRSSRLTPIVVIHTAVVSAFKCFRPLWTGVLVRKFMIQTSLSFLPSSTLSAATISGCYLLAEFGLTVFELLLLLPLETIKRRMFCQLSPIPRLGQRRSQATSYRMLVGLNPMPYIGALDALYRILWVDGNPTSATSSAFPEEDHIVGEATNFKFSKTTSGRERISHPLQRRESTLTVQRRRRVFWRGIVSLYRGFKVRLMTSAVLLLLKWVLTEDVD